MAPTPPPGANRGLRTALYVTVLLAICAYLSYGGASHTGLVGWLTALQIQLFGSASDNLSIGLPAAVAVSLLVALARRFDPRVLTAVPARPAPGSDGRPPALRWRPLLGMAAVPVLLSLPIYYFVQHRAEADEHRAIVPLDLISQPNAPVPADTKYVRLQAVFQTDYQYVLEQTSYGRVEKTDRYVPLTGPDWQPNQPVRFFLDTSTSAYFDAANQRTLSFDDTTPFPGTFAGELSSGVLPTVARLDFEKQGLRLADSYYLLDLMYLPNGQLPSAVSQQYWLIPVFGAILGFAILLGGGLSRLIRRSRGPA